jgi:hypothetical protein
MPLRLIAVVVLVLCAKSAFAQLTPDQIVDALRKPENSTGNIADAVEAVTGGRGWMNPDMKPLYVDASGPDHRQAQVSAASPADSR